uniref:Tumor protein p53-inducible nuclear protein 2-like n=1 Tax=Cyprinus carpio TaxID=7962 RepID=A0A8C2CMC0_CYPCA
MHLRYAAPLLLSAETAGLEQAGYGQHILPPLPSALLLIPPPSFTLKGATAEASPMEDLLIEHPSMSVYVSAGPLPAVEESTTSLAGSVSRMSESAAPVMTRSSMSTRVTRGAAAQAGALAKVTQVSRVQRAKARTERRHLARNRMQRQNRVREQVQRRATHTRNSFLHQPCQRNFSH